jgi:hypothetical protein
MQALCSLEIPVMRGPWYSRSLEVQAAVSAEALGDAAGPSVEKSAQHSLENWAGNWGEIWLARLVENSIADSLETPVDDLVTYSAGNSEESSQGSAYQGAFWSIAL